MNNLARLLGLKRRQNDLTHVLLRPVELATQNRYSGKSITSDSAEMSWTVKTGDGFALIELPEKER
jgi:hypothetical protein